MGDIASWLLHLVGAGLLVFAIGVYSVRRTLPAGRTGVAWVLALDIAWIIATPVVMVIYAQHLNLWGHLLMADVALLVSVFAGLEWYWLKRTKDSAMA